MLNKYINLLQCTYPSTINKFYVVNAPWSFTAVWNVIKGWIDEEYRKQVNIVSGDPIPLLLQDIDIDQLPDFLGGTMEAEFR